MPNVVDIVNEYWRLMGTNEFQSVGAVLAPEFTLEWPQSGEVIRGSENFSRINSEYPAHGPWSFAIDRLVYSESEAVTDVTVTDSVVVARAVSFFYVNDGKIHRIVEYWPDPFPAPANRSHFVEMSV